MPDADIIHTVLPRHYHKYYKQICEWSWDKGYLAEVAFQPIVKDIQAYGYEPIKLLEQAAFSFRRITEKPLLTPLTNWFEQKNHLFELKKQFGGNRRGLDLAMKACLKTLEDIRNTEINPSNTNIENSVTFQYLLNIYHSNFEDIVILSRQHYLDTDPQVLDARLNEVRPYIEAGLKVLAIQVASGKRLGYIKVPRQKRNIPSLNDDILSI